MALPVAALLKILGPAAADRLVDTLIKRVTAPGSSLNKKLTTYLDKEFSDPNAIESLLNEANAISDETASAGKDKKIDLEEAMRKTAPNKLTTLATDVVAPIASTAASVYGNVQNAKYSMLAQALKAMADSSASHRQKEAYGPTIADKAAASAPMIALEGAVKGAVANGVASGIDDVARNVKISADRDRAMRFQALTSQPGQFWNFWSKTARAGKK